MSKKGSAKSKSSPGDFGVDDLAMNNKLITSFQISRQLDQEKIDDLTRRVQQLTASNDELRKVAERNEKDTHDIVLYFQRDKEMKDLSLAECKEELIKRETQLKFEVEKMKKRFDSELAELQGESNKIISDLTGKLKTTQQELDGVMNYAREKQKYDLKLETLQKENLEQRQQMIDALDDQERKFLEEKSHVFRQFDEQRASLKEIALQDAKDTMGSEIKKIVAENNRIHEEMRFLQQTAAELQADKTNIEAELTGAKREATILSEKEMEYARQAHTKTKEIRRLRERVEYVEKQSLVNAERYKQKNKDLKMSVHKELEDATLDASGLRRLLKMKNQELRQMKALATTILSQRSDVEQFLLEALQEVRDVIRREKMKSVSEQKAAMGRLKAASSVGMQQLASTAGTITSQSYSGSLPQIARASQGHLQKPDPSRMKPSELPFSDAVKVDIKDLGWEDKELVLRILFAKINGLERAADRAAEEGRRNRRQVESSNNQAGSPMPQPVFISEGAEMPSEEGAYAYQTNFEVPYNHRTSSGDNAYLASKGKELGAYSQSLSMTQGTFAHGSQMDGIEPPDSS